MLGNWGRLFPFDVIFSANGSVFRAEHAPLLRTACFLSKTRVLRVRKERSSLKIVKNSTYLASILRVEHFLRTLKSHVFDRK